MFRVAPPATVDWYDVDFPEEIAARRLLLPARPNAHGIGADLTGLHRLDAVPAASRPWSSPTASWRFSPSRT